LRPKNVYCHYKRASLLKKMNQYKEAIQHYKLILFEMMVPCFAEDRKKFEEDLQKRFQTDSDIALYLKTQVKQRIPRIRTSLE